MFKKRTPCNKGVLLILAEMLTFIAPNLLLDFVYRRFD